VNPHQGDIVTFLQTSQESGGKRTLLELEIAPGGRVTPHYHLSYAEHFRGREGRITLRVGDEKRTLRPGEEAVVRPGQLRTWSNETAEPAVVRVELRPGHAGFEKSLRVAYGLAADGLVRANGMPAQPDARRPPARVNRGNSGGALVNLAGQVIGMPTLAATSRSHAGPRPGSGSRSRPIRSPASPPS
jgi:quercetin dioxygenase-like cupin family protein